MENFDPIIRVGESVALASTWIGGGFGHSINRCQTDTGRRRREVPGSTRTSLENFHLRCLLEAIKPAQSVRPTETGTSFRFTRKEEVDPTQLLDCSGMLRGARRMRSGSVSREGAKRGNRYRNKAKMVWDVASEAPTFRVN